MNDTFVIRLKKRFYFHFQFHYFNSVATREIWLQKTQKVLTLDERIKAIKLVESGGKALEKLLKELSLVYYGESVTSKQEFYHGPPHGLDQFSRFHKIARERVPPLSSHLS